jgi:D-serine dehydratase
VELAQAIQLNLKGIELSGIECYEGVIHGKDAVEEVKSFLKEVSAICVKLEQASLFEVDSIILTGGGTVFFDLVSEILTQTQLEKPFEVLIRPGCYLSHDSGIYNEYQNELLARSEIARSLPSSLTSAIEVLAYVQSLPEAGLAILNVGKRDVSFDSGLPKPEKYYSVDKKETSALDDAWYLSDLNDQHAFMTFPQGAEVVVGDIVILSVSHPCLTFDKWQSIMMTDAQYNVEKHIRTFFG